MFIYEKKSKRILNVDTGGNKGKFGAVAALAWNIDENTRRRAISLAVTFAKGFDAHVYEFHPLDLSVKSKAVLRETHLKRITCCAFHKGVLVLGSADGTSSVWMKDCDSTDEARYMKNASISRDASNEWARKRMLRHHFDKGAEAMPKSAITSTLIHFSDEEKNILHIVTCDASGRFKVWEGDTGHLEKIAKIHEVNWSGCGGIVKAALMRQKKTATVIGNEKHYLVTSHFDSNSNMSRALCWDAFVRNAQTAIRGYVHEYPKKDVPFYGRLSSVDFFAPSSNETKSMKNITKIDLLLLLLLLRRRVFFSVFLLPRRVRRRVHPHRRRYLHEHPLIHARTSFHLQTSQNISGWSSRGLCINHWPNIHSFCRRRRRNRRVSRARCQNRGGGPNARRGVDERGKVEPPKHDDALDFRLARSVLIRVCKHSGSRVRSRLFAVFSR